MKSNKDILNELKGEFKKSPSLPESLSEENILKKLKTAEITRVSKPDDSFFKGVMSAAAIFAVILLSALAFNTVKNQIIKTGDVENASDVANDVAIETGAPENTPDYGALTLKSASLKKAQSNEELRAMFDDIYTYSAQGLGSDGAGDLLEESVTQAVSTENFNGTTNEQTVGVSEGDIIKTDGRYLYIVAQRSYGTNKLQIFDTETMTYLFDNDLCKDGENVNIKEIYLKDNILTVILSNVYSYTVYGAYGAYGYGGSGEITVRTFDVSDKSQPKMLSENTQQGDYVSSRMIGNVLYTVTWYAVFATTEEELNTSYAPKVNGSMLSCDCIFIENENSNSYMCLTAIDTANADSEITQAAILTSTDTVYCSADTLYIGGCKWVMEDSLSKEKTVINAFSLDGLNIEHTATAEIDGLLLNQYSLDEYDGYLRIATNGYNYDKQVRENYIHILDKSLNEVSKITGIAENEEIKSVRFMGDEGYVVTFLNTDPLFCFDLSDPKNPKITGELKLPGFSTYLHPIGEDMLLGVGYGGDEENADFSVIKVSLFDVSDMASPREINSITFQNSVTPVNGNPRAFIYDSEKGLLYLPTEVYGGKLSCKIISVKTEGLTLEEEITHGCDVYELDFVRSAYIGDEVFIVSRGGITRYSLTDKKQTTAQAKVEQSEDYGYAAVPGGAVTVPEGEVTLTAVSEEYLPAVTEPAFDPSWNEVPAVTATAPDTSQRETATGVTVVKTTAVIDN